MVRIGIAGCGHAARIHLDRLLALDGVVIAGCADPDPAAAAALADRASTGSDGVKDQAVSRVPDHRELLSKVAPDALAIFSPHLAHYRQSMDALQAGCHVFIEKPLSTNLQEAADIVSLARGARFQSRSRPSIPAVPEPDRRPRSNHKRGDRPAAPGDLHARAALVDAHSARKRRPGAATRNWPRGASSPTPAII